MTRKILLASSSPDDGGTHVKVDQLIRDVSATLQSSRFRDHFDITVKAAATYACLRDAFLDFEDERIIFQFFGHGSKNHSSLVFQTTGNQHQLMSSEALIDFCRLNQNQIECLMLTSCDSTVMAQGLSEHVKYVITMAGQIHQKSAIAFSEGFYAAVTRNKSIEAAFHIGVNTIQSLGLPGHKIPHLTVNPDLAGHEQKTVAQHYQPILAQVEALNFDTAQALLGQSNGNEGPKEHLLRAIALLGNQNPRFFSDRQVDELERVLIKSYQDASTKRSAAILLLALHQYFYQANGIQANRLPKVDELMTTAKSPTVPVLFNQPLRQMTATSGIINHLNL